MYKLQANITPTGETKPPNVVIKDNTLWIPFAPDNTDYQNFKKQINADEAQLEDADGNLMTAEQAKEFVSTLP